MILYHQNQALSSVFSDIHQIREVFFGQKNKFLQKNALFSKKNGKAIYKIKKIVYNVKKDVIERKETEEPPKREPSPWAESDGTEGAACASGRLRAEVIR